MEMANNKVKNDAITSRDEDFAQWYTDVCRKAELMDYSSVKGFIIYRPYGYALWEMKMCCYSYRIAQLLFSTSIKIFL